MNNLKIYCVTNKKISHLEGSSLLLASVSNDKLGKNYLRSNTEDNIFHKEKYYSELTFHYWYWKNLIKTEKADWVGFCQRRRIWIKNSSSNEYINKQNIKNHILKLPDPGWSGYDSILCSEITTAGAKKIKMIKRGWKNLIQDPSILFDKKKETINFHFDMHHGYGNLKKAINLIKDKDKKDFLNYVNKNNSFNPHIMFITKREIAIEWFYDLFEWLEKCEKIFGFKNLKGYDTTRLYAYLAERYLSFWFKKYTRYKYHPWKFFEDF